MQTHSTRVSYFPKNLEDFAPWVAEHGLVAPYGECQCGCGEKTRVADKTDKHEGWRDGHPKRYAYNHHLVARTLEAALWRHVIPQGNDVCWEWQGTIMPSGYGSLSHKGKVYRAHRVSYEIHNAPVPDGFSVCHTCDNPACVNPAHLFVGTHQDNMDDRGAKQRHAHGARNGSAKLSENDVREIRVLFEMGASKSEIARRFRVGHTIVRQIIRREKWKHVD